MVEASRRGRQFGHSKEQTHHWAPQSFAWAERRVFASFSTIFSRTRSIMFHKSKLAGPRRFTLIREVSENDQRQLHPVIERTIPETLSKFRKTKGAVVSSGANYPRAFPQSPAATTAAIVAVAATTATEKKLVAIFQLVATMERPSSSLFFHKQFCEELCPRTMAISTWATGGVNSTPHPHAVTHSTRACLLLCSSHSPGPFWLKDFQVNAIFCFVQFLLFPSLVARPVVRGGFENE